MNKKLIQGAASAIAVVILGASVASAGHDQKMYNGTFCQLARETTDTAAGYNTRRGSLEYTPSGSIRNLSSSDMTVVCPIVQDSADRQVAVTTYIRTTRQAGSKGGCRLVSQQWDNASNQLINGWKHFDYGTGYDYKVISTDENTNTDKVEPWARTWIECVLPKYDSDGDLFLTQYYVDEWAP